MVKGIYRLFTAFFLLALFLGSKGIELHALSHAQDSDQVKCEWCDHALVIQSMPLGPAPAFHLDLFPPVLSAEQNLAIYVSFSQFAPAWEPFFARPPPTV